MSATIIEISGIKINTVDNIVVDGTKPVKERYYHSSRLSKNIRCQDKHTGRYENVELFSPVIYDLDNPMPAYNKLWEVYENESNKKLKKLIRINYPKYYLEWWYEQRRRCLEGYEVGGVYITGAFYFYLNFWRIKTKKRGGGLISPRFLDLDKQFFDLVEQARREDKNLLCLKRRQIGFTEKIASMCALEALLYPSSQSLIVAGEEKFAQNAFDKTKLGIDSLSRNSQEKAGHEFWKRRLKDQPDYIQFGFMAGDVARGYLSEIFSITTKDSPQAASGKSPTFVFLEEAGINPLLTTVYNMILPSVQESGKQGGRIIIIVGTGGEMKKGVGMLMEMFYNPVEYNLLAVPNTYEEGTEHTLCCPFFSAWYYHVTDNDGNSYKDAGIELIHKEREIFKNNKKRLHEAKTQMPLSPREAFSISGLSPFNTEKLDSQRYSLLRNEWKSKVQYGRFEEILEDGKRLGVRWVPADNLDAVDSDGDLLYPVMLIEHPDRPGEEVSNFDFYFGDEFYTGLYGAGTDSYDKNEANTSSSEGSMVIMKGYLNASTTSMMPVCRITWRPRRKEKFYKQTALACCYYGEAENLIEWSNISIMDWYKNNGFEKLLKEKPQISYANIKESQVNNKYGVDPNTKHVWIEHFAEYVEQYYENIYDFIGVQKLISFRNSKDYNCDITISYLLAWEGILDDIHKGIVAKEKKRKKGNKFLIGYKKVNGVLVRA